MGRSVARARWRRLAVAGLVAVAGCREGEPGGSEVGGDGEGSGLRAEVPGETPQALLLKGDAEAALAAARRVAAEQPREAGAFRDLASAALATGRLDEALEAARAGVRLAPEHAGGYVLRGLVHAKRGEQLDAERSWQEALGRGPTVREAQAARRELAGLARARGDLAGAATVIAAMVSAEPHEAALWTELALAKAGASDAAGAREAAREAVTRDAAHGPAQRLLAALAWDAGEHAETLERAVFALRIDRADAVAERLFEGALLVLGSAQLTCEAGPRPAAGWPVEAIARVIGALERRHDFEGVVAFAGLEARLGEDQGLRERVAAEVRGTCPAKADPPSP
jgi:tetratricopeptide (TPR) repeat protein